MTPGYWYSIPRDFVGVLPMYICGIHWPCSRVRAYESVSKSRGAAPAWHPAWAADAVQCRHLLRGQVPPEEGHVLRDVRLRVCLGHKGQLGRRALQDPLERHLCHGLAMGRRDRSQRRWGRIEDLATRQG